MTRCIYCRQLVNQSEKTIEHVIPQFLGGAYAPDKFKTRDVCRRCNSNLGLFVDAGFEKDWFVAQNLSMIAHKTYDPEKNIGLPLICMGSVDLPLPDMQPEEICELWLGPFGEQIYWVRPADERLYWYMGGNPRTAKTIRTRAYFMFSERTYIDPSRTMRTFRDAFADRKVTKITCTKLEGIDPASMGFSEPDDLDDQRIKMFFDNCTQKGNQRGRLSMYIHYDIRFLSKLSIGIAYCLFGARALRTKYAQELYRALVLRPDDGMPEIHVVTNLGRKKDPYFDKLMGTEGCITLALSASPDGVTLNLNIDQSMNWIIKCADIEGLDGSDVDAMRHGCIVVLSRQLQKSVELTMLDYIAHKTGNIPNPLLRDIESRVAKSKMSRKNS